LQPVLGLFALTGGGTACALYRGGVLVEHPSRVGTTNPGGRREIDDVIDPADSRKWITTALGSVPAAPRRRRKKRPCVDTW
jgi:hypothetical protein